ncbi:MAG: arsenite efflux transporter metallochaperone ArsD [Deltaproteobacteria bacterium]|nr:arsenite efflux transporter metallochaperone ArsD [Deltaproteobacteria bacterium]
MGKNELIIYEGAMCCSTGVCGPEPDRELIEFNETVKKFQSQYNGQLNIIRASLAFNSLMFFANKEVFQMVRENGGAILPITAINGEIVAKKRYLKYDELKKNLEERMIHD